MNPKLEFFKIKLITRKNEFKTFRDFAVEVLGAGKKAIDKTIFEKLHKHFIQSFKEDYSKNDKMQKRIYIEANKTINKHLDKKPNFNTSNFTISGVINGGKYGTDRAISNNDDENDSSSLGTNKTVASYFFIYLYLPPDHDEGFFMIHSNSKEDNISNILKEFFANLFKHEPYLRARITEFCPQTFQDEFFKGSTIKKLIFENNFVDNVSNKHGVSSLLNEFHIRIEAIPKSKDISSRNINDVIDAIKNNIFGTSTKTKKLSEFNTKKTTLSGDFDGGSKTLNWDLSDNDFVPVVYLKDRISEVNSDGTPDFVALKEFCDNIFFDEILPEIRPDLDVSKTD